MWRISATPAAVNRAIHLATTEYVVFANDDILISGDASVGSSTPCARACRCPLAPRLLDQAGADEWTVRSLPTPGRIVIEWALLPDGRPRAAAPVAAAPCTNGAIRRRRRPCRPQPPPSSLTRTHLLRVVPMPEEYFLYWGGARLGMATAGARRRGRVRARCYCGARRRAGGCASCQATAARPQRRALRRAHTGPHAGPGDVAGDRAAGAAPRGRPAASGAATDETGCMRAWRCWCCTPGMGGASMSVVIVDWLGSGGIARHHVSVDRCVRGARPRDDRRERRQSASSAAKVSVLLPRVRTRWS